MLRIAIFNVENLDDMPGDEPTLAERIAVMPPHFLRLRADVLCLQKVPGQEPSALKLLLAADQIAYEVIDSEMALCARGLIEITMPSGLCQHYHVSRPIARGGHIG